MVCYFGYYLTTDNECAKDSVEVVDCDIEFCLECSKEDGDTLCEACFLGLEPSVDGSVCEAATCNSMNCQVCYPGYGLNFCLICVEGYFLNSYFQCVEFSPSTNPPSCLVYNCISCYQPDRCALCAPGWNSIDGKCVTSSFCDDPNCASCTNATNCVPFYIYYMVFTCCFSFCILDI